MEVAQWFYQLVDQVIKRVAELVGSKSHQGGYLVILNLGNREIVHEGVYGVVLPRKVARHRALAHEKAQRLYVLNLENGCSMSSFEGRYLLKKRLGGAIRADRLILSFSGFSEYADETAVLIIAQVASLIGVRDLVEILAYSGNSCWGSIVNLVTLTLSIDRDTPLFLSAKVE